MNAMDERAVLESLRRRRPADRAALATWVTLFAGVHLPARAMCAGHATPLDYLAHSFFEDGGEPGAGGEGGGDALVWACRGGGKTMLGAIATLLDLLFKPGIQIRILGGSFEQSEKMYAYLRRLFEGGFGRELARPPTRSRLALRNGSAVEVLAQSDRAVRGQRVQKVRCDEVELFHPAVWEAVQLTTRSIYAAGDGAGDTGQGEVEMVARGAIEALSTMHRPGGLMQSLLQGSGEAGANGRGAPVRRSFAWCIWDVIARCHESRACATCPLWNDCGGRAKLADGFVPVEDVIAMHARVARSTWEHEMLCHPPRMENAVFPAFVREKHVAAFALGRQPEKHEAVAVAGRMLRCEEVLAGVDFGYSAAFVCLWVLMLRDVGGARVAWVVDETVTRQRTLARNAEMMRASGWRPAIVYCDVAGRSTNSQTGRPDEAVLRGAGFVVRSAGMAIEEGLALLNELIDPANGLPRLLVDPRCVRLIAALENYHRTPLGEVVKDGVHDHLIDALRYAVVNHARARGKLEVRPY